MLDISFFLPSIRPFNLNSLYQSIENSVGKYSFEMVVCGPYNLPVELEDKKNVKFIKDYGCPTRCAQIAALFCEAPIISLIADDATCYKGVYKEAIDHYNLMKLKMLGLKYGEGDNLMGEEKPYWKMWDHPPLRLWGVPQESPVVLASLMDRELFENIGGYEPDLFPETSWANHSLLLRWQNYLGTPKMFPKHAFMCTWSEKPEGLYGDHLPIVTAHNIGYNNFTKTYYHKTDRTIVDINSWKYCASIWKDRFNG